MQEHDARILLGAAIPTAVAGLVGMAVAYVMAGAHGLVGALVGTLLVLAFFAISATVVAWVAKVQPQLVMMAALATYTIKVAVLAVVLVLFGGTDAFHLNAFALTAAACAVVWITGHSVASMRVRRLYVEPADPPSAEPAEEAASTEAKP
ncbi:hypothetical protein [Nocardiopsis trehalosi]|jgi:ATP synthase protein I|uniref:hypothetical protein n=1 Tax=Nocardiopsis trehalosi TaxID=109329 RepID=UPI0008359D7A|nr:hypothetical protein [Nocardiopsis trehalosi]